jgi:hypothetical protein
VGRILIPSHASHICLKLYWPINQTPESIDAISENLSRFLVKTAKSYEDKVVNHGDESIIYEIYSKALSSFLKEKNISYN